MARGLRRRPEHGLPAIAVRAGALVGDQRIEAGAAGMALERARLSIEAAQGTELLVAAESGALDRRFEHADGLVIDLERHRERLAVLAAMRKREPRRVTETIRRAVHHLGHHGERPHRARADAGRE